MSTLTELICGVCGRRLDEYGTCRCVARPIPPVLAFEAGLAEDTGAHPLHPYECRGCGRAVRSLEWDGYCRSCGGPEPDPEELHARTVAAARQGHVNTARLLRRMAGNGMHGETMRRLLRDEARKLEEAADAIE